MNRLRCAVLLAAAAVLISAGAPASAATSTTGSPVTTTGTTTGTTSRTTSRTSTTTVMCDRVLLYPPEDLHVVSTTSTTVSLGWRSQTSATFDVYRDTQLVGTTFSTGYTDEGLEPGSEHDYQVLARSNLCNYPQTALSARLHVTVGLVTTTTTTTAAPTCTAAMRVVTAWGSGFILDVAVTNRTAEPSSGWTVEWAWPGTQQVGSSWNATVAAGPAVTFGNAAWNGVVPAGGTATFGLYVNGAAAAPPAACSLR